MSPLRHPDALLRALARSLRALKGTPYARMTIPELEQQEQGFMPENELAAAGDPEPLIARLEGLVDDRRQRGLRMVDLHRAIRAVIAAFEAGGWTPDELARLRAAYETAEISILQAFETELERGLSTDYLTGVANRRVFVSRLEQELQRSRRHKTGFALSLIDVDELKPINDTFGHAAGDAVLQALGLALRGQCRADLDLPARVGGDEFACVFVGATIAGAESASARIAEIFESRVSLTNGVHPTISWGAAEWRKGDSAASLMRRADRALYRMKRHHDATAAAG